MAQASQKREGGFAIGAHLHRGLREGALILVGMLAVIMLLALLSYHPTDPGWSHSSVNMQAQNMMGRVGAWFSDVFLYLFGRMAYLFPFLVAYGAWVIYREERADVEGSRALHLSLRGFGFILTMMTGAALAFLHFHVADGILPLNSGGILGDVVGRGVLRAFNFLGATLFLLALFLTGVTLFTGLSWLGLMDATGSRTLGLLRWLLGLVSEFKERIIARKARRQREQTVAVEKQRVEKRPPPRIEPIIHAPKAPTVREQKERQVPLFDTPLVEGGLPGLSLLDEPKAP